MKNIVTCQIINGRTYADVVDLINAIEQDYGTLIIKDSLRKRLLSLDKQTQEFIHKINSNGG